MRRRRAGVSQTQDSWFSGYVAAGRNVDSVSLSLAALLSLTGPFLPSCLPES